jgi:hypothetical protein
METISTRNLRVIFDDTFNFTEQISLTSRTYYYHIRDLWRIRRYLPTSIAETTVTALVTSILDYCNSLFNNIVIIDSTKLQCVIHCLAF